MDNLVFTSNSSKMVRSSGALDARSVEKLTGVVCIAAHSNVTWWRSGNLQIQSYKDGQVITDGGIHDTVLIDNVRMRNHDNIDERT